ncbi:catalase [Paenibacillus taihuensis]|uniref:Catalase n=1 Tax=Paenibacillus taihuensis TaxID=1156355 RepID=A0A3D9R244_9BACL|nr:hypothetical protein [Paenibacillus taihuensis]REE68029.1 catalase [Paenibacillus taihuensis]
MNKNQHDAPGGDSNQTLTTGQGHPVTDNQNIRTVGGRGPSTLWNSFARV